ncbi:VirB3 family type IV secretion system protein [Escherichia coli]
MSTLYKAMTRPAMYVGVPVVLLLWLQGRYFWRGFISAS